VLEFNTVLETVVHNTHARSVMHGLVRPPTARKGGARTADSAWTAFHRALSFAFLLLLPPLRARPHQSAAQPLSQCSLGGVSPSASARCEGLVRSEAVPHHHTKLQSRSY